eukprot:scaffold29943_cov72-Skeletonema_dohrnii-CCMP3373.AAC.1
MKQSYIAGRRKKKIRKSAPLKRTRSRKCKKLCSYTGCTKQVKKSEVCAIARHGGKQASEMNVIILRNEEEFKHGCFYNRGSGRSV